MANVQKIERKDATALEIVMDDDARVKLEECKSPSSLGNDKWFELLQKAYNDCFPPGWNANGHRFKLVTFQSGTECQACGAIMNGSVLQGYVCTHCGCFVDQNCLSEQAKRTCQPIGIIVTRKGRFDKFLHPTVDRGRAVEILQGKPTGAFLIRPKGGDNSNQKVLSLKAASDVVHIEIFENAGKVALGQNQQHWFSSFEELIGYYKSNNMSRHFSNLNFTLTSGVTAAEVN